MESIKKNLLENKYLVLLLITIFIIIATNYSPGSFLSGWDNLHPEFNPFMNIKRSLFAVWQEYQGVGLLGGMGHAADLPHQIFLLILSIFIPITFLRYAYHFFMLIVGAVGVYFLVKDIILPQTRNRLKDFGGFIAGLIYVLNLGTIQIFYFPYESFSTHFGFLPWLLYSAISFLNNGTKKNLVVFLLLNILSLPQNYVPTFFIVYLINLVFLCIFFLFNKIPIKKILYLYLFIFLINAFWLLPNLHFVLTKSRINIEAKTNLMATENNLLEGIKYGKLEDVIQMKSYLFDTVDMVPDGTNKYQLDVWKRLFDSSSIRIINFIIFTTSCFGIFIILMKKNKNLMPFMFMFVFSFFMIARDFPIGIFLDKLFYNVPLFPQIFRVVFNKLIVTYIITTAIFYAIAVVFIIEEFNRQKTKYIIAVVYIVIPIILFKPIFQGHFFAEKERAFIPTEYFQLFDFFKKQNKNERIANFPQYTFWGWTFYRWNYSGSGFLWYGIEQPILDRAFDVWSDKNENYYWELSDSLYSSNMEKFENVLEKYQINWLLVDDNVLTYSSAKTLYLDQLDKILSNSPKISLEKEFGKTKIYKVDLNTQPKNFVFLTKDLPVVEPGYKWGNYDKAYEEYGNYITETQSSKLKAQIQNLKLKSGEPNIKLSGGFGGFVRTSGSILADHKNGDHTEKSHDEKYRPEGRIGKNISSHNLNLLTINQLNPKRNIVAPKLDSTTPISFLSTNSEANRKAKETTPAFIQISENNRYSDLENRIISPEYHENKNIVNQILASEGFDPSTVIGVHAATSEVSSGMLVPDVYYPFRSLFTGRKQNELEFGVEDRGDYFSFKAKIPKELAGYKLVVPAIDEKEVTELDENDLSRKTLKYPQIYLDGEFIPVSSTSEESEFRKLSLPPSEVSLSQSVTSEASLDLPYIKEGNLEIRVPKINGYYSSSMDPILMNLDPKSCDQFNKGVFTHEVIRVRPSGDLRSDPILRLTSIGSSNCLDFDLPNLSQDIGYLVTVENRNIEGKSLLFSVINKNSQRADIETYLPKRSSDRGVSTAYFVISPMEQYGLGYTLHLDNISIGRMKTVNDLGKITVNPIPYRFLTGLKILKGDPLLSQGVPLQNLSVEHPNPSLYQINISNQAIKQSSNPILILSQSFDDGWKAYSMNSQHLTFNKLLMQLFPFWFGEELKDHVLVNNWENGWRLSNETMKQCNNEQCKIIIVYLPQYLEYIGFILLGVGILVVIFYPHNHPSATLRASNTQHKTNN